MNLALELTTVLVETLIVYYFLNNVFDSPQISSRIIICAFLCYAGVLSLLSIFIQNLIIRGIYAVISIILLAVLVYRSKILNSIYVALAFNLMVYSADILCIIILNLFGVSTSDLAFGGSSRIICIAVAKLIVLIEIQILMRIIHRNTTYAPRWTIPLVTGQVLSIFVEALMLHFSIKASFSESFVIVLSVTLIYLNLIICLYVETIRVSYDSRKSKELAEQQLALQIEQYKRETASRESTRVLWHDIKRYMYAMEDLLSAGNTEEAAQCLTQATTAISEIHQTVDVGNIVVDGILERALDRIRNTSISLEFDVWISAELPIDAVDLNIIMGNTIDNAIDACQQIVVPSSIHLVLRQNKHLLLYEIQNPIPSNLVPKSGPIHGYGLRNVRERTYKYHGDINVLKQDHSYTVSIQIPLVPSTK